MPDRAKFNDTVKEEKSFNYFQQGVHKVQISNIEFGFEGKDEKEYCEVTVVDPENAECTDKVRLWFHTEGAQAFSFSTLRAIFVHNAPEDKKDKIRENFNTKINGTEDLEKACKKMLPGKECWFSIYESDTRTYTDEGGTVRKSFDKNITGYEPKPKVAQSQTVTVGEGDAKVEGTPVNDEQEPFGF